MSKNDKSKKLHLINHEIKSSYILLLLDDGDRVQVSLMDALYKAKSQKLDLVQMGKGDYPACKIMDYNKFRYQELKKNKDKATHTIEVKEIQVRPAIALNDLNIKRAKIIELLNAGHDIRMRLQLKGREKASVVEHSIFFKEFAHTFENIARIEFRTEPNGALTGGIVTLKPINPKK